MGGMVVMNKKQVFVLFRSVEHRIIPKEMFENPNFRKLFVRNVFVLVTAGKNYPILLGHLMRNLSSDKVSWLNRSASCKKVFHLKSLFLKVEVLTIF